MAARIGLGAAAVVAVAIVAFATIRLLDRSDSPAAGSGSPPPAATTSNRSRSPAAAETTQPIGGPTAGLDAATGILFVEPGEEIQAVPPSEDVAVAFSGLLDQAMAHPGEFGYPWLDPVSGELVLSAATARGRVLAIAAAANLALPSQIRDVDHSYAELQRIQDDATRLVAAGLPDAELIYRIVPDERDNRTMIVISEMSRALVDALAQRYPPDAIAIQVDPNRPPFGD